MTDTHTYANPSRVPRKKQFPIRLTVPLTAEVVARADAALDDGEVRLDLIRTAIETELRKREARRRRKP